MQQTKRFNALDIASAALVLALGFCSPVKAASLTFTPTGSQLDADPINDINVSAGTPIDFVVRLNTSGLSANLITFDARFDFDTTELQFTGNTRSLQDQTDFTSAGINTSFNPASGIFSVTVNRSGPGADPNTSYDLFTDHFTVLPGVKNDGLPDYTAVVLSAIDANGTDVTSLFNPGASPNQQEVEVQTPEPNLILGTIITLGVGVLSTQRRKYSI